MLEAIEKVNPQKHSTDKEILAYSAKAAGIF